MSDTDSRHPLAQKPVVHRRPGMELVRVQRDMVYSKSRGGHLALDVYHPAPSVSGSAPPVVVFVSGLPDVGVSSRLGCLFKDVEMFVSLARLAATSGMAAVTYTTRQPDVDIDDVFDYLDANASLQIDTARVGLWAVSAHVPVALSALMRRPRRFRAAVLSNGYTLDLDGNTVADTFRSLGLVAACEGRSTEQLPADVPLFIARSGQDEMTGLNSTLERFVEAVIARNLPVTFSNHPTAPHAFEVNDDSKLSRVIIEQMLEFMQHHLS